MTKTDTARASDGDRVPGGRARTGPLPLVDSPRLIRLAREAALDPAAVDEFWGEVERSGTPIVEPASDPASRIVTFVVRRAPGDTREVLLQANRLTDPARPRATVLAAVPGTDVLALSFEMSADWRASYQFTRHDVGALPETGPVRPVDLRRHRASGETDPLARRQFPARNAVAPSSVVELDGAPAQPWRVLRDNVAPAAWRRAVLHDGAGLPRSVRLLVPPAGASHLVVLLDGEVWAEQLPIAATFDNLRADGATPPVAALLVDSGDETQRWRDYTAAPAFLAFLVETAIPWAAEEVPGLEPAPERTVIAGESLGAVFALWAAITAPETFGGAVAQSPSLWWRGPGCGPLRSHAGSDAGSDGQAGRSEWLTDLARLYPARARIQLAVGLQEWVLLDAARRLRDVLTDVGYELTYREYNGGHDHACWWGGIGEALADLHRRPDLEETPR